MSVFVDTSAFYALLVSNDESHDPVRAAFASLVTGRRLLWTTSFVIVETIALLQHRIGLDAAKDFDEEVLPAVRVRWVDDHLYRLGIDRLWREDRRQGAWSIASASSSCGWSVSARPSRWTCTSRTLASTCCREHAEAARKRRRRPRAEDPSLLLASRRK